MSEAMKTRSKASRFYLLTTVSSVALISSALGANLALADEYSKEPALWIEIGLQFDRILDSTDSFALPVGSMVSPAGYTGPLVSGLNLPRSQTENGKITFEPGGTDWVFSASVTYGRSGGRGKVSKVAQGTATSFVTYKLSYPHTPVSNRTTRKPLPVMSKFDTTVIDSESHLVVDFQAGKDVGLGLFGHDSAATLSAGVRFAHFAQSRRLNNLLETNGIHFQSSTYITHVWPGYRTFRRVLWDSIAASDSASQSFAGAGPSVTWQASIPLKGDERRGGEFQLDWGVNAAILFGKQKTKEEHRSSSTYRCYSAGPIHRYQPGACARPLVQHSPQTSQARSSKNVTVPNLGGFAGISYRLKNFKASFGYKADYFFRAVDTGITGQRDATRSFQGPYASISIGVGD
jgi:hypothetical protein